MPKTVKVLGAHFDDDNPNFTLLNYATASGEHALQMPKAAPLHLLHLLTALLLMRQDQESQEALQLFALNKFSFGMHEGHTPYFRYRMEAGFEFMTGLKPEDVEKLYAELGQVREAMAKQHGASAPDAPKDVPI